MKPFYFTLFFWVIFGLGLIARAQPAQLPVAGQATTEPVTNPGWLEQKYGLGDFAGKRSALEGKGVTLLPIYSAETFGNPTGGTSQGIRYDGLLDLELNIDFKKMAGWDANFHASAYYPMGSALGSSTTHELFTMSDITAYNTPHLYELWYDQKLFNDKVSLRFGQLAVDSEFCISSGAANFLNATYGWPAVISGNTPSPVYAYAGPGIRLALDPEEHWHLMGGVYSGNPAPDRTGDPDPLRQPGRSYDNSGTDFNFNPNNGLFAVMEAAYKYNQGTHDQGLPGTYKIGSWLQTGTFSNQRYDDHGLSLADPTSDGIPRAQHGNYGFYSSADQAVYKDTSDPKQNPEIDLFLRAGNAQPDRSTFDFYVDGGVAFNGFIPGRPSDLIGLATAYGHIGSGRQGVSRDQDELNGTHFPTADYEQNIEITYYAQLAPWWNIQPDLQFLLHPGGSTTVPDALVLGCRTVVTF